MLGGREYLEVAESIDAAAGAMSRLDVDGTISQAVDAVMATKEDTVADIRRAHGRYAAAGEALVDYAQALERVQAETLAALEQARVAQERVDAAAGSQGRWQDLADGATDGEQRREYQQQADRAAGIRSIGGSPSRSASMTSLMRSTKQLWGTSSRCR